VREAEESQAGGTLLLIVPDSALARALSRIAEGVGLVPIAALPHEAAEMAALEKPRIVLIDLALPGDALALCREVRESAPAAPFIAITADAQLPRGAREAGLSDFVSKPVDREMLATRIAFHLEAPVTPPPEPSHEVESRLRRIEASQALAGIGYWEWDVETDKVRVSPAAAAVLELRDPLPVFLEDMIAACVPAPDRQKFFLRLRDAVEGHPEADGLLARLPGERSARFVKHFVSFTARGASPLATITVRDVTQERRAEESARRIAYYDGLTGLPNRRLFEKRLAAAMRRFADRPDAVALLFLDLDGFKQVNDRLGHAAGDELLRVIGQRLIDCVRDTDQVARPQASASRFGGDEFAVLLTGLRGADDAADCARRIYDALSRPIDLDGNEARVGVSVGIALHPRDGATTDALLTAADAAMYAAKSDRSSIYCFFRADLHAATTRSKIVLEQLSTADQRGELSLAFQPKFDLATGNIAGAEVLARWTNVLLGQVHPMEFIPVAEESGIIHKLGRWVLDTACEEAARWSQTLLDPPAIAVNVSRVQLVHGDIERVVYDALMRSSLDPRRLELEITESLMIEGENAMAPLRDLGAIGLTLSLDDFGSGYSTLASLVRFPASMVKLDRALVKDIDSNPDAARVLRAVIRMAHELGKRVVAEGVDRPGVLRVLREVECDEAQGFLLAKPMLAEEFRALIESWRPADAFAKWR
jgi:diguanylate cyclase (GGDEF)-like protein